MKNLRIVLAIIYLGVSFLAIPKASCGAAAGVVEHACCCANSGSCSPDMPMDCCANENEQVPTSPQLPATEFVFQVAIAGTPLAFTKKQTHPIEPTPQVQTKGYWEIEPPKARDKAYLAHHSLIFYA